MRWLQIFDWNLLPLIWSPKGFQIALVNRATEMEGLQIGLLNFNGKGFLPVFPFFQLRELNATDSKGVAVVGAPDDGRGFSASC